MYGNSVFPAGGEVLFSEETMSFHNNKRYMLFKRDRTSSSVTASGLSSLCSASTSLLGNFSVTGTHCFPVPTEETGSMCIWEALEEQPTVGNPLFLSPTYN